MNDTNITYPRILPSGDAAFTVEFGNGIDLKLNRKVYALEYAIQRASFTGVIEMIPSYRSLLVRFNPYQCPQSQMEEQIESLLSSLSVMDENPYQVIEIPVHYGGEDGPDLDFVAEHNGLTAQQVVEIHTSCTYPIYMMGFTPGFPYLGGMDPRIAAPRLENPRTLVPAGSVGIAGEQTGIYSINSPGGWRLIGKTEVKLFDPKNESPFLLSPGDHIRFVPVKGGEA
ncbi:MAG: 5-oxoprolinase subunit PxpB [Anaerolineae bacterium]|jgi:KipI family sensor histidine kinase inhibitor|nr:5-oxoprolinase subunit PxpB [Anaerolineae bacterium]